MKILEIIPQLGSGGAERFTVDLCNELAKEGHQVKLLVLYSLNNPLYAFYLHEVSKDIEVISLNKTPGLDLSIYGKICSEIKKFSPDVVHSHVRAIFYLPLAVWKYHNCIKFFHTVHNDAQKEALGSRLDVWIRRLFFQRGWVKPITISPESQTSFTKFYGFEAPMIYNGRNIPKDIEVSPEVDSIFKQLRISDNTKVIVNVAHIDSVKRQNVLAKAITHLNGLGKDVSLILVGRYEEEHIVNEIRHLQNPRIRFMGARTNPLEFMKAADAFCLTSRYEGLPISLIEAIGVGTIPICTPVGGIKDLIKDGINGFLSADISEQAITKTLERFIDSDIDTIYNIKSNLSKTYARFTMTACASCYMSLFQQ